MLDFTKVEKSTFSANSSETVNIEVNADSVWLTTKEKGLADLVIIRSHGSGVFSIATTFDKDEIEVLGAQTAIATALEIMSCYQ